MSEQIRDRKVKLDKIRALGADPSGSRFPGVTKNAAIVLTTRSLRRWWACGCGLVRDSVCAVRIVAATDKEELAQKTLLCGVARVHANFALYWSLASKTIPNSLKFCRSRRF